MEYEIFSTAFFSALFAIVLMDLVLAGDNALVIGLVARNLPKNNQNKVIVCGALGAIAVRAAMAILVVYLLDFPGLMLGGGIALIWTARKLLTPAPAAAAHHIDKVPVASFAGALRTIIVADAVMGIDNVLAIGGAAHGNILLIVLGLTISVPIIVWGSHLVIRLVDRFPSVVLLGGAVLAWTAYSMIVREPLLADWLESHAGTKVVIAVLVFSISLSPWCTARLPRHMRPLTILLPALPVWMLAFEAVANVWGVQVDYLLTTSTGGYLLEGLRWLGWLPLAVLFLWAREQIGARLAAHGANMKLHTSTEAKS